MRFSADLEALNREFAKLGLEDDKALSRYQLDTWEDLQSGLDERAIAGIMNPLMLKIDALEKRTTDWRHPKPRVDLSVWVTSKENIVAEWDPSLRVG